MYLCGGGQLVDGVFEEGGLGFGVARFVSTDSRFWSSQGHLVAEYASRPGIGH